MVKKSVYLYSFVSGFLYVFGLSENPSRYLNKKFREQNDNDEIAKDWENIGTDIQKSYEKFKSTCQVF